LPVKTSVPPQEPVYHCTTAPVPSVPPVAVSEVLPLVQVVVVPVMLVGATDEVAGVLVTSNCKLPVVLTLE